MRWADGMLAWLERLAATDFNRRAAFVSDIAMAVLPIVGALALPEVRLLPAVLVFGAGLFVFSLIEYCFHRWLFHGPDQAMQRGHARHHQAPTGTDTLPFFLPPICLALLAGLFNEAMPAAYALLLTGAIGCGYFAYGECHGAIHRLRFRHPWARRWSAHHHVHHHHDGYNFGVTSPLWDIVFRTQYERRRRA
jgi:dihydroceramide fatty acyl 2-hydroxylase